MTEREDGLFTNFTRDQLTLHGDFTGVVAFAARHGYSAHRLADKSIGAARRDVGETHELHAVNGGVRLLKRADGDTDAAPWVIQMPLQRGEVATWCLTEQPERDAAPLVPVGLIIALFAAAGAAILIKVLAHLLAGQP